MSAGTAMHCLNCGSTDLLAPLRLNDQSGDSHRLAYDSNPHGGFTRGTIHAEIAGVVCGSCGYIALFAVNPVEFVARARQLAAQHRPG